MISRLQYPEDPRFDPGCWDFIFYGKMGNKIIWITILILLIFSIIIIVFYSPLEKEDSSIISCLNKITELIKTTNEKPTFCGGEFNNSFMNLSILEYKKFTNTQEAMNYLNYLENYSGFSEIYPDLFDSKENKIIEHKDIVTVLVKFEIGYNKELIMSLPMICINGTLAGHSEERLIEPVGCLDMPTAVVE